MSWISKRLQDLRESSKDFKRTESNDEKEVKEYFKNVRNQELDYFDLLALSTEFEMWKERFVRNDLKYQDFINHLDGKETFEEKPIFTDELKKKVLDSLNAKIEIPKYKK